MRPCECETDVIVRDVPMTEGNVVVECSQCEHKWVGVFADGALHVAPDGAVAVEG